MYKRGYKERAILVAYGQTVGAFAIFAFCGVFVELTDIDFEVFTFLHELVIVAMVKCGVEHGGDRKKA
jgi:hypothetical protein